MAECGLLGVAGAVTNLGWAPARIEREMAASTDAKMFKGRVRGALQRAAQRDADKHRLLARNSSRGYVDKSYLALADEPEAVSAEYADVLAEGGRDHALALWEIERDEIASRIAKLKADPKLRPVASKLRLMERQLADVDGRVRRLATAA